MSLNNKHLLFVDDMYERWEALSQSLPPGIAFCCWAPDANLAIDFLKDTPNFDIVCLDHDLAGEDYSTPCSERKDYQCGCKVVDWIYDHKEKFQNTRFIIHSWNPAAAIRMHEALVKANLKSVVSPFKASRV